MTALSRIARLASAAAVVGVLALVAAQPARAAGAPAPGGDEVTWAAQPADNDQGSGRPNYAYHADPGDRIDDGIVVTNFDKVPHTFDLYAADALTTPSGALDILPSGTASTDVGTWVALAERRVEVPAGASLLVPFTVQIPDDATPGDHIGGVVSSLSSTAGPGGISVERRLGARLYVRVGGELTPGVRIAGATIDYTMTQDPFGTSDAVVHYTVVNTGNTRIGGAQSVTVSGPFGVFARTVAADDLPEILPGASFDVSVVVSGVRPSGLLTATIDVRPQVLPADGDAPAVAPLSATASVWAVPWLPTSFAILLLALLGFGVWRLIRRGRRRRGAAGGGGEDAGDGPAESVPPRLDDKEPVSAP